MALEPFDYAVIAYAELIHTDSEVIYKRIDDLATGYRENQTQEQLFDSLNKVMWELNAFHLKLKNLGYYKEE